MCWKRTGKEELSPASMPEAWRSGPRHFSLPKSGFDATALAERDCNDCSTLLLKTDGSFLPRTFRSISVGAGISYNGVRQVNRQLAQPSRDFERKNVETPRRKDWMMVTVYIW